MYFFQLEDFKLFSSDELNQMTLVDLSIKKYGLARMICRTCKGEIYHSFKFLIEIRYCTGSDRLHSAIVWMRSVNIT